jgi:hypothetical protein
MKRITLTVLALTAIILGSYGLSSAQGQNDLPLAESGDYTTCMNYCMPEGGGFNYCHGQCKQIAN